MDVLKLGNILLSYLRLDVNFEIALGIWFQRQNSFRGSVLRYDPHEDGYFYPNSNVTFLLTYATLILVAVKCV